MKKTYGLKFDKKKDPNAYVLGGLVSLPKVVLQADGQWDAFLPEREAQNTLFETYNCTGYGTNAALETLLNRLGDKMGDRSDRYLGIKAGTKAPGNDPHKVAQAARDFGVISESSLPFKNLTSINEYFSFKNGDAIACDFEGQDFLKKYEIGHEYVWNGSISKDKRVALIKEALQYSPLGVSVTAWTERNGVYVDNGQRNNHWTVAYGYTDKGIKIFDSYDNCLKFLSWDHNIEVCKRYHLEKQATQEEINIFSQIVKKLAEWVGLIAKQRAVVPPTAPVVPPVAPTSPVQPIVEQPISKYDWDTPVLARHSVRVICDEEKLSVKDKNDLCATVGAESGWKPSARLENKKNGKVWSTDWGICQINDHYHIGPGKSFPSVEYVVNNPEACVRWMCKQWKAGNKTWWVAYKSGAYKQYL